MEEKRNEHRILIRKSEGKDHVDDVGVDEVMLQWLKMGWERACDMGQCYAVVYQQ
jgi:hypothetical protein